MWRSAALKKYTRRSDIYIICDFENDGKDFLPPCNRSSISGLFQSFQNVSKKKYLINFVVFKVIFQFFRFCQNAGFQFFTVFWRQHCWNVLFWAKSRKSEYRYKTHEYYRILFFRSILETLSHFWCIKMILGSMNLFYRFENLILCKYLIFE